MSLLERAKGFAVGKRPSAAVEQEASNLDDNDLTKRMKLADVSKRKCSCCDKNCSSMQAEWNIYNNARIGWVQVPEIGDGPPKGALKIARHTTHLRRVQLFREFISKCGEICQPSTSRTSAQYLSYIHFHPAILRWWESEQSFSAKKAPRFPSVVPALCGSEAGLQHVVLDPGDWLGHYIAYPTLTCTALRSELLRVRFQQSLSLGTISNENLGSVTPRNSLDTNSSSSNNEQYALSAEEAVVSEQLKKMAPEQAASVLCDMDLTF